MAAKKKPRRSTKKANAHGGSRAGAGRKRGKLPPDVLEELGPPPDDVLEKTLWWSRALELIQYAVFEGLIDVTLLRDARASALVASKLVPEEIKARAAQLLAADDRETHEDDSPKVTPRKGDKVVRAKHGARRRDPS